MPALNFQAQFARLVECGLKRQTIRSTRRRRIVVGDRLYLYTGQRTRSCRKLGEADCVDTVPVIIFRGCLWLNGREICTFSMLHRIATDEGFDNIDALHAWFDEVHRSNEIPFCGDLIRW